VAIEAMKLVTIVGQLKEFDSAVRSCIINQEFHPESALSVMKQVKGLYPFEQHNPYSEPLNRAQAISDRMGIPLDFMDFPTEEFTPEDIMSTFDQMEESFTGLNLEKKTLLERMDENRQLVIQLQNLHDVSVPLQDFFHFNFVKFRFGRMPRETYLGFYPHIVDRKDVYFFQTNMERDYVYGMYMTPRAYAESIDSLFASLHFERLRLSDRLVGTSEEALLRIHEDDVASQNRIAQIDTEINGLKKDNRDRFLQLYSYVRYMNDSYNIRQYAAHTEESFYILGWVPKNSYVAFNSNIESRENLHCVVVSEDPETLPEYSPPVKLKNFFLFRAFEPFLAMYGLPSYNEIDPTPLMAITYSILFGIMYGDLGQGLVLALAGFLLWRFKQMWLGKVLIFAGVCGAFFGGVVFGSVFGYEELPWGFKVLGATANSQTILTVTVYAGAGLITVAMLLNIINGFRQKNMEKALYGSGSLAGMALYWGVVLIILPFIGFGSQAIQPIVLILCIALPLILVFLREPLSFLTERRGKWKTHNGTADFFLSNFFELFETLLSYMTNTLSFLRVGAYAISHAALMTVVYDMAHQASGGHNPVVLVIGNIIVIAMEALLVAIQVLRLDFYELFGRFYQGSGRPYRPIKINYRERREP
jgi:V/A-type H+-transporting ATPase subunit I